MDGGGGRKRGGRGTGLVCKIKRNSFAKKKKMKFKALNLNQDAEVETGPRDAEVPQLTPVISFSSDTSQVSRTEFPELGFSVFSLGL